MLILSRRFVDSVDDQALAAILAHEIVHIAYGDLRVGRIRAVIAFYVGAALAIASAVLIHLPGVTGMPIWIAAAIVGILATTVIMSPLNRPREQRADVEGAKLVGDPQALARALAQADALSVVMSRDIGDRCFKTS